MFHDDELSLFLQEVADVRPIRSDNTLSLTGNPPRPRRNWPVARPQPPSS